MQRLIISGKFFGLDLARLSLEWVMAIDQMGKWLVIRWLTPAFVTRVKNADGKTTDFVEKAGKAMQQMHSAKNVKFFGFLLPDEIVLWHSMVLPKLAPDAVRSAIELEVRNLSPFLLGDVVWGYTPLKAALQDSKTLIVISSRKLITQHIASLQPSHAEQADPEIWVKPPGNQNFVVLNGFGEQKRRRLASRWQALNFCLVFLLAIIGLAAAVTPTAQLRLRTIQATLDYEKLSVEAAPALQQRELLIQLHNQVAVLQGQLKQGLKPELLLLRLTQLLSDDTFVSNLQVQDNKILLTGQTPNTAALMQQLGAQAGVKDVRSPTGAIKQRGADRETFNIEFILDTTSLTAKP